MLLRHIVPNNCAPFALDAIAYASEILNRLLAGVKGRRRPHYESAAIMDARLDATWLLLVNVLYLYILVVTNAITFG